MALTITTSSTVTVTDTSHGINLAQTKTVTDSQTGLNMTTETYNLPAGQANYQLVTVGDIDEINDVFISVTAKTALTFDGIAISLTGVDSPDSAILEVWDSFTLTGATDAFYVKNLDPTNTATIIVVLGGTNA